MASNEDVKLLGHWASPYSMRPRIALNIKSVAYEYLQETFGNKSELLLKSNPVYKKIPVLIHEGKSISESLVIVQYIDEVWSSGPAILPQDPYEGATARFWTTYTDEVLYPTMKGIMKTLDKEAKRQGIEKVFEAMALLEDAFIKCSKGKPFFGGDKIGYVDIALGSFMGWFRATEYFNGIKVLDEKKLPRLAKWAERFVADEAVKELIPNTGKLVEFAKVVFAQFMVAANMQED